MPYNSEYFDVVTGWDVIEHFPEPPFKLLKEIKRILKKDGTLLVSVPNLVSTSRRGRFLLGRHPYMHFDEWIGERYYGHYRECTRKEWQIIIEKSGFSQVKTKAVVQCPLSAQNISIDKKNCTNCSNAPWWKFWSKKKSCCNAKS